MAGRLRTKKEQYSSGATLICCLDAPNEYANAASSTAELAKEQGRSLASLSTMIGRNAAYLNRFVTRGSPRRLLEQEPRHLAIVLNVEERELGARDPWSPGCGV